MKVTVKIENDYSDGHHSEREVVLDAPDNLDSSKGQSLNDWFEEVVYPETGDGHGAGRDLGSCYTATIVKAEGQSALDGQSIEWTD